MMAPRARRAGLGASRQADTSATGGGGDEVLYVPPTEKLIREANIKELRREFEEVRRDAMDVAGSLLERCREAEAAELEAQQEAAELREQLAEAHAVCLMLLNSRHGDGPSKLAPSSNQTGAKLGSTESLAPGQSAKAVCKLLADLFARCLAPPARSPASLGGNGDGLETLAVAVLRQCTKYEDELNQMRVER